MAGAGGTRVWVVTLLLLPLAPVVSGEGGNVACAPSPPPPLACPDLAPDARLMESWSLGRQAFPRPGSETDCAIEEGLVEGPGERALLRFATGALNVGAGALAIGDPRARPDWYAWSPCHGHWHFNDFAHYRVWDAAGYSAWSALRAAAPTEPASRLLSAHPELAAHLRAGHKQGFCIVDGHPLHPLVGYPSFATCDHQGISPGWEDVYGDALDGQWVDVTGLAAGTYVLEVELNPERRIEEAGYADNAAATLVTFDLE